MDLNTRLEQLTRVGKTTAARLKYLGLTTVHDLIYYFPFRYEDYSKLKTIAALAPDEVVTVRGRVDLINNRRSSYQRKIVTEALITDDTGALKVVWFNQPYIAKSLKPGDNVYLSGKVEINNYGLQMKSPVWERQLDRNEIRPDDNIGPGSAARVEKNTIHTARIVPVYYLTMGVTEKQLRFLLSQVLPLIRGYSEILPAEFIQANDLMPLNQALENIHFPKNQEIIAKAKRRLQFDEMFLIQLRILELRRQLDQAQAFKLAFLEKPTKEFVGRLPFKLTDDQKKAAWEIIKDLGKGRPMNRLLEGDVGSGKTVVAAIAMVNVARNGYKTVLMAPTEILAQQHYDTLVKMMARENLKIGLFTRSNREIAGRKLTKKQMLDDLQVGDFDVVVGTHALIQADVKFKDLGLVAVDEQHRFGVGQRQALIDKEQKMVPHFLSMTATPIPRTLSLALFGDLDLSIIKQQPPGRRPIISKLVPESERDQAYKFIREQIAQGRQAFVICPLIDPSDKLGVKSVTEEFERLDKEVFADLAVGLMHGKLKPAAKEQVMQDFLNKKTKVLVSTSVIEVGIDVPNAVIMMIEGADRFGLSQLHQFRGRVGRGAHQSYCYLFTANNKPETRQRLKYFVDCKDGFELAEKDLQLRGAGEVYGTRQSGLPEVRLANLLDAAMIKTAKQAAEKFTANYNLENFPGLKASLEQLEVVGHLE